MNGAESPAAVLEVEGLRAGYGPVPVLHGFGLRVDAGEVVVLLGANGAGKTTTLRAISKSPPAWAQGRVTFLGRDVSNVACEALVRRGLAHVPQGRGTFAELSVDENLRLGAFVSPATADDDRDRWYDYFPRLAERRRQLAGSLSGGEQQMLAIARALMCRPRLLLLDEPSLGLAPQLIEAVFEQLGELNRTEGITMLIVEQNAELALEIAHRGYVLEAGALVLDGAAADLADNDEIRRAYLGMGGA